MLPKINPTKTLAWQKLRKHHLEIKTSHLNELFESDANRFKNFSLEFEDILFDYSKNIIDEKTLKLLVELAKECRLDEAISSFKTGVKINETESRAVLHTALRNFSNEELIVNKENATELIKVERDKVKNFSEKIHSGELKGYTDKTIKYIVNIGIGGSDLGSSMVSEALLPYRLENITPFFISNVDGSNIYEVLKQIDFEETLFIVASKTFTTKETLANANTIKDLFLEQCKDVAHLKNHFIAVTANSELANSFGIPNENIFKIWDWVCGRFSLWGSMGITISLIIGYENYENLLRGANSVDKHFHTQDFDKNIPVLMGLLSVWYINFFDAQSEAILSYDYYLSKFKSYLQQGAMESNGKSTDRNGLPINYQTGVVTWGEIGTNGQHSFHQLLHQGTSLIPCDFIVTVKSHNDFKNHRDQLICNALAQTEALMKGKTKSEVIDQNPDMEKTKINYKVFSGNKPTNTILIKKLTPYNLGSLIALYEHKIFVQGIIWNIFSFDQWGVELGKELSSDKMSALEKRQSNLEFDSSTNGLLSKVIEWTK